jgi:gliding motility-associated-like protein
MVKATKISNLLISGSSTVDKFACLWLYSAYIYNQNCLSMKPVGLAYLVVLITVGVAAAQDPQWEWVRGFHTVNSETAEAVVSDPNTGEVYLAGEWRGSLAEIFPAGTTESTDFASTFGGVDGLVVKLDPTGNTVLWAFKVGGEGDDYIHDIHLDHEGFLYIAGSLGPGSGSLNGTGPPRADADYTDLPTATCFLARYDPAGAFLWFRRGDGMETSGGEAIASNTRAVFLTGHHQGTISFQGLPSYTSMGGEDLFVVSYTLDGAAKWHISAGSDQNDWGESITCDEDHLYVGGGFSGALLNLSDASGGVISATVNTADGQADALVAGFTTDGLYQWSRVIASAADDECRGIAMDSDHVYLAGTIGQEAVFPLYPDNPVPSKGGRDAYVCALGRTDGTTRWVRTITGEADGDQVVRGLSMDRSGSIFVTGFFTASVTSTDQINESKGLEDIFLASFSRSGDAQWIKTAGSTGRDEGNSVCAMTPGAVYLAGEYTDFIAFDSKALPADSGENMFLARLNLACLDAVGGQLTASDTLITAGGSFSLILQDYYGEIRWELSPPGMNNWRLLTADLRDSVRVFPGETSDYRAFLTSGSCAPDSSNVVRVHVVNTIPGFADAGEDVKICPGDSIRLKASGGDLYKWEPTGGLDVPDIPDPWARPLVTTTYVVHVTRSDGLTDSDTVTVFVYPRPLVDAGPDLTVCKGEQVKLTAEGDGTFRWYPPEWFIDPTLREPVAVVGQTIEFRVVITDANGCSGADRVTVFAVAPPLANAGSDKEITARFEARMDATLEPGEHGTWVLEAGSGNPEDLHAPDTKVTGLELGENIFSWNVSNDICPAAADPVKITVLDLLFPTVITPNGDGKNDYFNIHGIEHFSESELVVLNRWGEEVYHSDSPYLNSWNGTDRKGNDLPEETYYVILKISAERSWKGYLVIVR